MHGDVGEKFFCLYGALIESVGFNPSRLSVLAEAYLVADSFINEVGNKNVEWMAESDTSKGDQNSAGDCRSS